MNPPPISMNFFLFHLKKKKQQKKKHVQMVVHLLKWFVSMKNSPFYKRNVELDNGSNVKIIKGVALAICKSYLDKNVQEVTSRPV